MKHYVYKLTNKKNGKIYIGVRSHPDPVNDGYMSSSRIISNIIKVEGSGIFTKQILHYYTTREEAESKESCYLTEDFCNSSKTYNVNYNDPGVECRGFRNDLWDDYYDVIRDLYKSGSSTLKIAEKFSCDKQTVNKIVSDIIRTKSEAQVERFKNMHSGQRDTDFDEQYLQECIKLYEQEKWSVNRIATHFNRSTSLITRRLLDNGIKIRERKHNNESPPPKGRPDVWSQTQEIVSQYERGYNKNEIADQFNCSRSLITRILNEQNVNEITAFGRFYLRNKDKIKKLYDKGLPTTKIHQMVGNTYYNVKKVISKINKEK